MLPGTGGMHAIISMTSFNYAGDGPGEFFGLPGVLLQGKDQLTQKSMPGFPSHWRNLRRSAFSLRLWGSLTPDSDFCIFNPRQDDLLSII